MKIRELLPREVLIPIKVGLWWKRNEIGKKLFPRWAERRATRRRKREAELTSELIALHEREGEETVSLVKKLADSRTSTKAGLAGIIAMGVLHAISWFASDFPTVGLEEWITAVVMWVIARKSKTPANPGALAWLLALPLAFALMTAQAEQKTVTITPASDRIDESPLPQSEIAGHLIECSLDGGEYTELDTLDMPTLVQMYDFAPGQWVCRAWTVDTGGLRSQEASVSMSFTTAPALPKAPAAIEIS